LTLLTYTQDNDGVTARIAHPDGAEESCRARYLIGCDGARSRVRELLDAGFPGGTYSHLFYVADVQAGGPVMNGELSGSLDADDFLAVFPMKGDGRGRFIGAVRPESVEPGKALSWGDVSAHILETMRIRVDRVNWFSTYHVHHRVADRWRDRRVFIVGDAAHIHSPVGGQGMNTGIGDAVNLGWKLAEVLKGQTGPELLETYQSERIGFARRLVRTTDQIFVLATSPGPIARFMRMSVLPPLLPRLMSLRAVQRFVFRTISQTAIHYRRSRLSSGAAGRLRGGDRLPWVTLDADPRGFADNFAPLVSRDWQLHVYGAAAPARTEVPAFAFAWNPTMNGAGLVRGAHYLIRPDGYVARITSP
jgi:2-polyprenyl-6-methoxyphenol hydroxylase-like FAD-dependent oxidoreductase